MVSSPIYEDEGPQVVEVKVTLKKAVEASTRIDVRLEELEGRGNAIRITKRR